MASTCKTPNQNLEQFLSIIDLWALSIYFNEMGCMLTSSVKDYRGETGLKIYGGQFHSCPPPPPSLLNLEGGRHGPPAPTPMSMVWYMKCHILCMILYGFVVWRGIV